MTKWTLGNQVVPPIPLHAMCGRWREVLKDGERYCVVVGEAEAVSLVTYLQWLERRVAEVERKQEKRA